jgi:hypothetical protein
MPKIQPPYIPDLPPWPDFSEALCVDHGHPPDLWTSDIQSQREAAIRICQRCPVLAACAEWSVSLSSMNRAIYGARLAQQRVALRAERRRQRQAAAAGLA